MAYEATARPRQEPTMLSGADIRALAFGLFGAFIGLVANSALEWLRQHLVANRDAEVLRRALTAELRISESAFRQAVERAAEAPFDSSGLLIPLAEAHPVYDASIGRLGHLRADEVGAVVEAYAYLKALPEFIYPAGQFIRVEGRLYAMVPHEHALTYSGVAKKVVGKVSAAIAAMR
jgi:hypothetical protein